MRKFVVLFLVAFVLLAGLAIALPAQATQQAPLAAPTPVSIQPVAPNKIVFPIFNGVITESRRISTLNFTKMRIVDVQYTIDVSDTQTVTARLDYSNDNLNWVAGSTIASNVVSDTNDMVELYAFGGYGSVTLTLATSMPVTVSLYAAGQ